MLKRFFFVPGLRIVSRCVLRVQKVIRQLWRALLCVFVVFVGVGRMAFPSRFCRIFVESLKTIFTGGGPFPAKCTCTQEHFGAPPFRTTFFIKWPLSSHDLEMPYRRATDFCGLVFCWTRHR